MNDPAEPKAGPTGEETVKHKVRHEERDLLVIIPTKRYRLLYLVCCMSGPMGG